MDVTRIDCQCKKIPSNIEIFFFSLAVQNQFTIQSDIWSFGITLWEIMNHCRMLPYHFLNDEQVHRRLSLAEDLHLSKPDGAEKEVIDLMLECWRPNDQRPTFKDIAMFFNKCLDVV